MGGEGNYIRLREKKKEWKERKTKEGEEKRDIAVE